jgi:8-oxo-dGTP pyrophosphatase MutT (NUDIX family)/predicted transcriptional regulator
MGYMIKATDLHPTQASILRELLFKKEARFSDLNITKMTNDHFTFHIRKLIKLELISKTKSSKYELTIKGKEFANRFDTDTATVEKQAKIGVLIIMTKEEKGNKLFLIQNRLKQPFYGYYGCVTGKVRWGETIIETAHRELMEETGLDGDLEFTGVQHKMDYSEDGMLLDDKYFYVFRGKNPKGTLMKKFEGGKNFWMTREKFDTLPKLFDDMPYLFKEYDKNQLFFFERKFSVKGF